jgi:hypothetical protein
VIAFLRRSRAIIALAALLVLGAVVAQAASGRNPTDPGGPALSSRDAGPEGTLALAVWLESLGYHVDRLEGSGSSPSDAIRYLFVLKPSRRLARPDAVAILDWIRRGGTLVYVPNLYPELLSPPTEVGDGLARELDLAPGFGSGSQNPLVPGPGLPFFTMPAASQFRSSTTLVLNPIDSGWIPLIEVDSSSHRDTVVARRRYGSGQVVAIASGDFLSNAHLGDDENFAIVLNVLARGPSSRVAAFDEYHHGVASPPDLLETARSQPWGWLIGYLAVVSFVFALWSGRRFGPPIVRERLPGRSTGDYVTAFAGLLQRNVAKGGASAWAQAQYSRLIRRGLGRTQGVRSDLPAQDLARILAERRPIDRAALTEHLIALGGPPLSDRALLETVRSIEPILRILEPTDLEAGSRKRPTV